MNRTELTEPLSDDDFEALSALLAAHSPLDYDGLLGLFHAVALAPGSISPSAWLPVVLPSGLPDRDVASADRAVSFLFRQYNEIVDALQQTEAILPDEDDLDACESFAAGYAAGAELDPTWKGDEDRWTFVTGMAYLGGRLDLLTEAEIKELERELAPAPKEILSQHLAATIRATHDAFRSGPSDRGAGTQQTRTAGRVGRNDPCPCGSGKKYKRCCNGRSNAGNGPSSSS